MNENLTIIETLIKNNDLVNLKTKLTDDVIDEYGEKLLRLSIISTQRFDKQEVTKYLYKKVKSYDDLLHLAISAANIGATKYLLKKTSLNIKHLDIATFSSSFTIFSLIVEKFNFKKMNNEDIFLYNATILISFELNKYKKFLEVIYKKRKDVFMKLNDNPMTVTGTEDLLTYWRNWKNTIQDQQKINKVIHKNKNIKNNKI